MRQQVTTGRSMFKPLSAALIIRLTLAPFLGHPFDLRVFMAVGWAVAHGVTPYGKYVLQNIFTNMLHPHLYGAFPGIGYPPPWGLITGLMYLASTILSPNNLYAYILALKIPIILGELATAYLIYRLLKPKLPGKVATKACVLYLFCPYIISVGTIWGMFDVIAFLFTLLSAHHLLRKQRLSSLCLATASALKLIPIVLAPLYSILIYKSAKSGKRAVQYLLLALGLTTLFTLAPMIAFKWPLSNMYHALSYHVTTTNPSYETQAAFPYGAASPFNAIDLVNNAFDAAIQPPTILNYLWIPACVAVYILAIRKSGMVNFTSTIRWSLLTMLTFFTTRAWVSDPNLLFLFSFFLLATLFTYPISWKTIHTLWILLFSFVMIHVPAISFLWIQHPWTLNAASAFCDGPLGWTRLLSMAILTFAWLALSWRVVIKKIRWKP